MPVLLAELLVRSSPLQGPAHGDAQGSGDSEPQGQYVGEGAGFQADEVVALRTFGSCLRNSGHEVEGCMGFIGACLLDDFLVINWCSGSELPSCMTTAKSAAHFSLNKECCKGQYVLNSFPVFCSEITQLD
jgi:hypothetical protein